MTTMIAQTISLPAERLERSRRLHPARRALRRSRGDAKLELLRSVDGLSGVIRPDLLALAATADVINAAAGTVLEEGWRFGQQWWMPVDGWLLAEGDGSLARTVPSGYSWVAPRFPAADGRLTALRDASVLVARVPTLRSLLAERPRLATALRSTLVGGDV